MMTNLFLDQRQVLQEQCSRLGPAEVERTLARLRVRDTQNHFDSRSQMNVRNKDGAAMHQAPRKCFL